MLQSNLLGYSADAVSVAEGARTIFAPEDSDTVALVQIALLGIGFSLPDSGVDGVFGTETGEVIKEFKKNRLLSPSDPVVGVGTMRRLDMEFAYLEGNSQDPSSLDATCLSLDAVQAGFLENQLAEPSVGQKVIDFFQLGDKFCFRPSMLFDNFIAIALGRFLEEKVFQDFCARRGPCTTEDFFDRDLNAAPYTAYLKAHNPLIPPSSIDELASIRRPDIITNRDPVEWWEVKPSSIFSAIDAWDKFNKIIPAYASRGLPYLPGRSYSPTPEIILGTFLTPEGENLRLILSLRAKAPGLIFWELCIRGDYVSYFNRVRIAAGIAALLIALAEILLPAAEAAAAIAALKEALAAIGIVVFPILESI